LVAKVVEIKQMAKAKADLRQDLNHFRLLRMVCKDYGLMRSKAELTAICKRAAP